MTCSVLSLTVKVTGAELFVLPDTHFSFLCDVMKMDCMPSVEF